MQIYKKLVKHIRNNIRVPRSHEKAKLLDREFTVHRGTIRTPDYDDAWLLASALHSEISD